MKLLLATVCAATAVSWSYLASADPESSEATGSQSAVETAPKVTVRAAESREFDWAKLQARARVAYTSSGPRILAGRMIDNDPQTVFRFSASDSLPIVIVELARSGRLHRLSAVFHAENARLDFFLLDELPKSGRDLESVKPFASVSDAVANHGKASIDFAPNNARYVALRWTRHKSRDSFEVAEISAFSNDPSDADFSNSVRLASDNGTNSGGLVTDPPAIGVVSP
jgi:hypothetical protein